jgi:hypothetical protein
MEDVIALDIYQLSDEVFGWETGSWLCRKDGWLIVT